MRKKYRAILYIAAFILALALADGLGSGIRAYVGILQGQHGKPSFVTNGFQIYGVFFDLCFITAYLVLGRAIPVKNGILRGITFALFFCITDYLPQILGMSGGVSTILAADTMSIPTIIGDTIGYLLRGIVLGFFLVPDLRGFLNGTKDRREANAAIPKKDCSKAQLIKACLISMVTFPLLLIVFEIIAGSLEPSMYCTNSFGITGETYRSFYIVFYLLQAFSGLTFPIFYRFSEYNRKNSYIVFTVAYGCCLWLPVVVIVMFFGVNPLITWIWGVMMLAAICIDTWLFCKIFISSEKTPTKIKVSRK